MRFFVKLKSPTSAIIVSVSIKYSMRDLICYIITVCDPQSCDTVHTRTFLHQFALVNHETHS